MGRRDGTQCPTSPVVMELDKHSGYRKPTLLMRQNWVYFSERYLDIFYIIVSKFIRKSFLKW